MQLYFYALDEDFQSLLDHLIFQEGFRLFEGSSVVNETIREFKTSADWLRKRAEVVRRVPIRGWSETFGREPVFRTVTLASPPESFRVTLEGPAMFQLNEPYRMDNGALFPAHLSHWTEAGARRRSRYSEDALNEVDWKELMQASRRVKSFVRHQAEATINKMPILPAAHEKFLAGDFELWNFGERISPQSDRYLVSPKS